MIWRNLTTCSQADGPTQKSPLLRAGLSSSHLKEARSCTSHWFAWGVKETLCQVEKDILTRGDGLTMHFQTFTQDLVTHHHVTLQTKGKHPQVKPDLRPYLGPSHDQIAY